MYVHIFWPIHINGSIIRHCELWLGHATAPIIYRPHEYRIKACIIVCLCIASGRSGE